MTTLRKLTVLAWIAGAFAIAGCGESSEGAAGAGGVGGMDGVGGEAGVGSASARPPIDSTGGFGGIEPYQVCTLGLCLEDERLGESCLEDYDACVGRGHYPRSCRMEADMTCDVFGQTGPY